MRKWADFGTFALNEPVNFKSKRQKHDYLRWAFKNGPDKLEIVKIGGLSWELEVTQKFWGIEESPNKHGPQKSNEA